MLQNGTKLFYSATCFIRSQKFFRQPPDTLYIEVLNCVEWELEMTIDAKKIISTLSVPLENTEWKALKNINHIK